MAGVPKFACATSDYPTTPLACSRVSTALIFDCMHVLSASGLKAGEGVPERSAGVGVTLMAAAMASSMALPDASRGVGPGHDRRSEGDPP